jgi:hypothetical protein
VEGEAEDEVAVEEDFDGIEAGLGEFEAAEDGDIGGVEFGGVEDEAGVGVGEGGFVGAEQAGGLGEGALAGAPAGEDAEFEDAQGIGGGGDGIDDADEGVGACRFEADVFAEQGGLEIGDHEGEGLTTNGHEWTPISWALGGGTADEGGNGGREWKVVESAA